MDLQVFQEVRRLYRTDPKFRQALQDNPAAALARWKLGDSKLTQALATSLCTLLHNSSAEIVTAIQRQRQPDWQGCPPEQAPFT